MNIARPLATTAHPDRVSAETALTALRSAQAAWNAGDLAGYLKLYDQGIRLHGYSPTPMTKAEVEGFYRMVFETLRDNSGGGPRLAFEDIIVEKDRVGLRFVMSGHHVGPFMGHAPTGRPYILNGITILRFAGERVVERWSCADMLGLLIQIGAIPPPAMAPA